MSHLCIFSGEIAIQIFCLFLSWVVLSCKRLASWTLTHCLEWVIRILTWRLLLTLLKGYTCSDPAKVLRNTVHWKRKAICRNQKPCSTTKARTLIISPEVCRHMDDRVYLLVWMEKENESCFIIIMTRSTLQHLSSKSYNNFIGWA